MQLFIFIPPKLFHKTAIYILFVPHYFVRVHALFSLTEIRKNLHNGRKDYERNFHGRNFCGINVAIYDLNRKIYFAKFFKTSQLQKLLPENPSKFSQSQKFLSQNYSKVVNLKN